MSKHQEIFDKKNLIRVKSLLSYHELVRKKETEKNDIFEFQFIDSEEIIKVVFIGSWEIDADFITFKAEFPDAKESDDMFRVAIFYDPNNNEIEAVLNNNSSPY